jgi:putative ABC transport system substrate-binding protein
MTGHGLRLAVLVLAILVGPLAAEALQGGKVPRIGVLTGTSSEGSPVYALRQGLRELGYVEGQNIVIEWRWADGRIEQLPDLAAELVRLKVDVIVTNSTPAARAAKNATRTIPIVLGLAGDPVRTGLVASLARPGGNVTGLSGMAAELAGKRLELLREILPTTARVAVLLNPGNPYPYHAVSWSEAQNAARVLGLELRSLEVRAAPDLDRALSTVTSWRAQAVWMFGDPELDQYLRRILNFAARRRLPTLFDARLYAEAGGLVAYGVSYSERLRRAAVFVDKILKGAKPADLPVEQPTKFELIINLKTAKALGLTIPQSVLVRADEVIK